MSGVHVVRVPGGGLGILHARLAHRFGSVNMGVYLLMCTCQGFCRLGRTSGLHNTVETSSFFNDYLVDYLVVW